MSRDIESSKRSPVWLQSIATALPRHAYTTAELCDALNGRLSPALAASIKRLGVETRYSHVVGFPERLARGTGFTLSGNGAELAALALRRALDASDALSPSDIGLLVTATNTQPRLLPGLSGEVMALTHGLLRRDIPTVNMQGQGCSSLLKAVEVVDWFLASHPGELAVVIVSESQTPYIRPLTRPSYYSFNEVSAGEARGVSRQQAAANTLQLMQGFLFGDGAVALVLGETPQSLRFGDVVNLTNVDATDVDLLTVNCGGSSYPFGSSASCSQDYVMDATVPATGARYAVQSVEKLMRSRMMTGTDMAASLRTLFVHTGSQKILDAVVAALGYQDSDVYDGSHDVLRRYGNLSSASIGFMLAEHAKTPGLGMAVSFGVGFSAAAGYFHIA